MLKNQTAARNNMEDAFYFNPDASEFVPVNSHGVEEPDTWDAYPSDQASCVQGNWEPVIALPPCNESLAANGTFYESSSNVASTQPSFEHFQLPNCTQDFTSTFHYFPEPPNQAAENITEGERNGVGKDPTTLVHEDHMRSESPSVVPIKCIPIYKFIGYSYAVPSTTTETPNHALFKVATSTISENPSFTVPMQSPQPQVEFAQQMSMQIPIMQVSQPPQQQQPPPQLQQATPAFQVLSVPVTQQLPPHQAPPNSRYSHPGSAKPSPFVRVFIPNVPGSGNTQKGYPTLIPAIAPQNGMYWAK